VPPNSLNGLVVDSTTNTAVAGAIVTVSGQSAITAIDGSFSIDLATVLPSIPVGADGLQRLNITVEAAGYGLWTAKNKGFFPGGNIEAQLTAEPHTLDWICIPRAAQQFHPECSSLPSGPLQPPEPPTTGSGGSPAAANDALAVAAALIGAAMLAGSAAFTASQRHRPR